MAYDIGTARGIIEMEYNGRGVEEAQSAVEGLEGAGTDAASSLNEAAKSLSKMGGAVGGALALAVNSAANFEQRMSAVAAVSGASSAELDALRNKALQLGKDTAFSAGESAQAMEELVKAGLTVEDVLNGAADATVNLAAAGEVDMVTAATIASNAMNQFNIGAEGMAHTVDLIAGAANASAIDVTDFGQSLAQVGAVAKVIGVSFDDTATAIALLGNAGIKGSDAGTALKTMLGNLQPATKKQAQEMERLGLITEDGTNKFFNAKGELKSLDKVSGILNNTLGFNKDIVEEVNRAVAAGASPQEAMADAAERMGKASQYAALETLFGSDAIRAAAIMASEGKKGFNDVAAAMGKVSAADVAAKRLDNFKGSLEALKGSMETLAIQIGTPLLGGLRVIVDAISSMIEKFIALPAPVQEAIAIFGAVLSVGLLLAAALVKAKAALIAFRAGAMAVTGPILLIVAAIAAAVAAFVYFYKNNEKFREFVNKAAAAVKAFISDAIEKLTPIIKAAIPHLINAGKAVANFLGDAFEKVLPILQDFGDIILNRVFPAVKQFAETALTALGEAWAQIQPKIMPALKAVLQFGKSLAGVLIPVIKFVVGVLIEMYKAWLTYVVPVLLKVAGIFTSILVPVIGTAIGIILTILTSLFTWLSNFLNFIKAIFTGQWGAAWTAIKNMMQAGLNIMINIARLFWEALKGGFRLLIAVLKGIFSAGWAALKAIVKAQIALIIGVVKGIFGPIVGAISGAFTAMKNKASTIMTGLYNTVKTKVEDVVNKVKEIKDKITGFFSGAAEWLVDSGKKIVQGLIDGMDKMLGPLDEIGGKIAKGIGKFIPGSPVKEGPLKVLNRGHSGQEIVKMLIGGIEDMAPALRSAMSSVTDLNPTGYAMAGVGTVAAPRSATSGGDSGRARIVSGELALDPSGRAFITGVAADADDDHDDYADTLGRMN